MNGNRSAPVIFILTPIIKLMDRLPYLYKFILVSTVFTLPLALLCAVQIQHLKADITDTNHRLAAINKLSSDYQLLNAFTEYRVPRPTLYYRFFKHRNTANLPTTKNRTERQHQQQTQRRIEPCEFMERDRNKPILNLRLRA